MGHTAVVLTTEEALELVRVLRDFATASMSEAPDHYNAMYVSIAAKLVAALGQPNISPWVKRDMRRLERMVG